jgi:hypothetical protein
MRNLIALLLATATIAVACTDAVAQTRQRVSLSAFFPGDTPVPADVFDVPASLTVTRSAPPGGSHVVIPTLYTHLTTDPETQTFEWANLAILNNYSNYGENVAAYGQANKFGRGTTWGGVFELQDHTGTGGFYGVEIDAYTQGGSPYPGSQQGDRIGLGIIMGRAGNSGPTATVDYGILVAPTGLDDTQANVNFGVMVWSQCRYACFAMRGGNKLAWEESARIASKFDPATGRWGLFNGDKPVFEVDVNTGELRVNGRPVQVTFKD